MMLPDTHNEDTQTLSTEAVAELMKFANWVRSQANEGATVGVDVTKTEIALSDGRSYVTSPINEMVIDVLRLNLRGADGIKFVAYDMVQAATKLAEMTGIAVGQIANYFAGDLTGLTYCTGIEYPDQGSPIANATSAVLMWRANNARIDTPAYYKSITIPIQRIKLSPPTSSTLPKDRWVVTYPELIYRVIAHMSNEPMLLRVAQSDDILKRVRDELTNGDQELAQRYVLYTATGFDRDFFERTFAETPPTDAENLLMEHLPAIRMMALSIWQEATSTGGTRTLYGRRQPLVAREIGPVVWFRLGGTVQDLLEVAQVTLSNAGAEVEYTKWASHASFPHIKGTIAHSMLHEFTESAASLTPLAGPLGAVPLMPVTRIER